MLVASAACLEHGEHVAGARAQIRDGTDDLADPQVLALQPRQTMCGLPTTPFCTGTLIAPRVALTAAHCFNSFEVGSLEVFAGSDVGGTGEVVYATEVLVHPDYDRTTLANDLALVRLAVALDAPPARMLSPADPLTVGQQVRIVGFGITGPEAPMSAGTKREGTAEISAISPTVFTITPSPSMSCDGDSGGPVFATVGEDELLAGVTSRGDEQCLTVGENTRVDAYAAELIVPFVDETADLPAAPDAGPPRPDTVDPCSETCSSDDQCPEGTTCQFISGSARCAYPGLPVGYFEAGCELSGDCPGGTCVARERAGRPECACYYTCAMPMPDAGPSAPDAGGCDDDDCDGGGDGCGCRVGRGERPAWPALLILLAIVRLRRRSVRAPRNTHQR